MDRRKWKQKKCLMCRKRFMVRTCYIKRGQGKFCSLGCGTRFRNLTNNPTSSPETRRKISLHHADVSGANNPMFGRKLALAPSYIDGRSKFKGNTWRKIALANLDLKCSVCHTNNFSSTRKLHIHHEDGNRLNNELKNLRVVCVKCHNTVKHPQNRSSSSGRFSPKEGR